nr:hypothetical protein Iba_chr12dCG13430 [Ipomoea batatas]
MPSHQPSQWKASTSSLRPNERADSRGGIGRARMKLTNWRSGLVSSSSHIKAVLYLANIKSVASQLHERLQHFLYAASGIIQLQLATPVYQARECDHVPYSYAFAITLFNVFQGLEMWLLGNSLENIHGFNCGPKKCAFYKRQSLDLTRDCTATIVNWSLNCVMKHSASVLASSATTYSSFLPSEAAGISARGKKF